MVLDNEKWFKAIQIRRSRRTFISKEIEKNVIDSLQLVIKDINRIHEGARLVLVEEAPDTIILGAVGPYGRITGANAFVFVVVDYKQDFYIEKGGYIGQAITLETVNYGLASCWVGGFFQDQIAANYLTLSKDEIIIAVIPIGYARKNYSLTEKMMNQNADFQKRKSVADIVSGVKKEEWPSWLQTVLHSISLAPSAYNRQSLNYIVGQDYSITILLDKPDEETIVPKGLDRGIAMLHIDVALQHQKKRRRWKYNQSDYSVTVNILEDEMSG